MSDEPADPRCSICGTPRSAFKDADSQGRPFKDARSRGRLCSGCGSGERQRVFAQLLDGALGRRVALASADVFAIAPTRSERIVLDRAGIGSLTVGDIRPEVKPDICVDITNMPEVASERFDVAVASYVLTTVHDLRRAVSEFARILKPGGALLTTDPERVGENTLIFTDVERITKWYGREAYEKYHVGAFRRFGELDYHDLVGDELCVQTYVGIDAPTGERIVWHASFKHSHQLL